MKAACLLLLACISAPAMAQTPLPAPAKPDPMIKRPAEPGMKAPGGDSSVVVPPTTGNEEIAKQPKTVDPGIDDATGDIDRKNRKQLEDKSGQRASPMR